MTTDTIEAVRALAPAVATTTEGGRARQRRKLTDAMAAEASALRPERVLAPRVGDVPIPDRAARRRRLSLAGAAAVIVAAAAVALPLALQTSPPSAAHVTNTAKSDKGAASHLGAAPVMRLASYRLRLPHNYRLTAASATECPAAGVTFVGPGSSSNGTTASSADVPDYAAQMAVNANAEGGCIFMVLAPPYTPTAADPDPEAGTFESTQPVQVGPYTGRVGSWTSVAKPSGVATQQAALYVQIPLTSGQDRDLVVSANNLSASALVSLVANGLSVTGSSGTSDATR